MAKWSGVATAGGTLNLATDVEGTIAGLIFGCDKPSKDELKYARFVLDGASDGEAPGPVPESSGMYSCKVAWRG